MAARVNFTHTTPRYRDLTAFLGDRNYTHKIILRSCNSVSIVFRFCRTSEGANRMKHIILIVRTVSIKQITSICTLLFVLSEAVA